MADRANVVVVRESGEYELHLSRFGAVGIDLQRALPEVRDEEAALRRSGTRV